MENPPVQVILSPAGHKVIVNTESIEQAYALMGGAVSLYDDLQQHKVGEMPDANAPIPLKCAVHGVDLVHRKGTGKNGAYDFWSCPQKMQDGTFCKWRPEKKEEAK